MKLLPLQLPGPVLVEPELIRDQRGFFTRLWCPEVFRNAGLNDAVYQVCLAGNQRRGTLRGMHYQCAPCEEAKVVRCVRGSVYDVVVDIRSGSPHYLEWIAVELDARDHRALYIPEGFAHGYQTLEDETELEYQISVPYDASASRGLRHDDPALGIDWPLPVAVISERDLAWEMLPAATRHRSC